MNRFLAPLIAFWQMRYGRGFRDREHVARWQNARGAEFRRDVMPRAPLYANSTQTPFADLPAMDRDRLMQDFDRINTVGLTRHQAEAMAMGAETGQTGKGSLSAGFSTGTSGRRGLFLTNRAERALWAGAMLGRFWPRPALRRQRVALFLRADNRLYQSLGNAAVSFDFFPLADDLAASLARLQLLQPTVLIGPPSVLIALADAQTNGALSISPRRIIAGAEVAEPQDLDRITAAFGQRPDVIYQCTEGVLALTCRHGNLHLNEAFVSFQREVIDMQTGAFVPIISDFTRQSLPILNYRLDDVLVPDPTPCACGCASTRIAGIEGRLSDALFWRGQQGERRWISSDALRRLVLGRPGISDWAAQHAGSDSLQIFLPPADVPRHAGPITDAIARLARQNGCFPPHVVVQPGLPATDGPKRRRVRAA